MPAQNTQFLNSIPVARYAVERAPTRIQHLMLWSFQGVAGRELLYAQVPQLVASGQVPPCDAVPDRSSVFSQATFGMTYLNTRVRVCHANQDTFRTPITPEAAEYPLMIRQLLYGFSERLDAAPSPANPLALRNYIEPDRIVNLAGGALNFHCLGDAWHRVDANDGRPTMIMSATPALATYELLCRMSGFEPPKVDFMWYDPVRRRMTPVKVTAFNGTPWLVNDRMEGKTNPAAGAQRIYFMVLGDDGSSGPTRGVTGIVPQELLHSMFVKRVVPAAYNIEAGIGDPIAADDVFLGWPVGTAVGSPAAISLLQNFSIAGPCPTITPA
ncbi:MAG: hypothetical protein KF696_13970 [Planctomycetes bacterium]|nr:hypothetical protein [Planctomycetota bacterium]MCW8136898.1 hypothetical protein [Planctomycetota bacterium]